MLFNSAVVMHAGATRYLPHVYEFGNFKAIVTIYGQNPEKNRTGTKLLLIQHIATHSILH